MSANLPATRAELEDLERELDAAINESNHRVTAAEDSLQAELSHGQALRARAHAVRLAIYRLPIDGPEPEPAQPAVALRKDPAR